MDLSLSHHARVRQAQRAISEEAIYAALDYGRRQKQRDGRTAWYIGHKQVAQAKRKRVDISDYQGTLVVQSSDGMIVTVVKTQNPRNFR